MYSRTILSFSGVPCASSSTLFSLSYFWSFSWFTSFLTLCFTCLGTSCPIIPISPLTINYISNWNLFRKMVFISLILIYNMTILYDYIFTFTNLFAFYFSIIGLSITSIIDITAILTDSITGLFKIAITFISTYAWFAATDRGVCTLNWK